VRIAATCGCFDLIHDGHINVLRVCRRLGDTVVVFLNSDESVARIKGDDRPMKPFEVRAAILRAITYVDAIIPFNENTPAEAIRKYIATNPELNTGDFFWVKGADSRITGLPEDEKAAVQENGGMILYFDNPSTSHSSDIKGKIIQNHGKEGEE